MLRNGLAQVVPKANHTNLGYSRVCTGHLSGHRSDSELLFIRRHSVDRRNHRIRGMHQRRTGLVRPTQLSSFILRSRDGRITRIPRTRSEYANRHNTNIGLSGSTIHDSEVDTEPPRSKPPMSHDRSSPLGNVT